MNNPRFNRLMLFSMAFILLSTICCLVLPVLVVTVPDQAEGNMTRLGGGILVLGLLVQIQYLKAAQVLYPPAFDASRDDSLKTDAAQRLEKHECAGYFFTIAGTILSIFAESLV